MSRTTFLTTFAVAACTTIGCSHVPPRELTDARSAYQHASVSGAADVVPAELHKAKEALVQAELSFEKDPKAGHTLDLAYVAHRKAQLAEALASIEVSQRQKAGAERTSSGAEQVLADRTKLQLADSRMQLAAAGQKAEQQSAVIDSERQGRLDANQRANEANLRSSEANARAQLAQDKLNKLAAVKAEARGMVITLSGSVLFASDQAVLLPEAQTRLTQVADALLMTKERNLVIEGHSDSRGSASHNLDLSQRRAEAVRSFIQGRGYEADRMQARGMGPDRPLASNGSAEGRANNRRVEIIIEPTSK